MNSSIGESLTMSVSSSESESQAALTELEKGLRSAKVGEQAEAIVRLVMTYIMSDVMCLLSLDLYTGFPTYSPSTHSPSSSTRA